MNNKVDKKGRNETAPKTSDFTDITETAAVQSLLDLIDLDDYNAFPGFCTHHSAKLRKFLDD